MSNIITDLHHALRDQLIEQGNIPAKIAEDAAKHPISLALAFIKAGAPQKFENPIARFNTEFNQSLDDNGQLAANSRLGALSIEEFEAEKENTIKTSTYWNNNKYASSVDIAARMMRDTNNTSSEDDTIYNEEIINDSNIRNNPEYQEQAKMRYARNLIARDNLALYDINNNIKEINHVLDYPIAEAFCLNREAFAADTEHFSVQEYDLYSADGNTLYIHVGTTTDTPDMIFPRLCIPYIDEGDNKITTGVTVKDELYQFLISLDSWNNLAQGILDNHIADYLMS